MAQLPIEIFPIIFKNVEFIDLIKLREVCRLFRNIIDDKDYNLVDELCVNLSTDSSKSFERSAKFWSLLDGKRLIKNRIDLNRFNLENKKLFITKFVTSEILKFNLKYLKIYFYHECDANILMHLCNFIKLEVLEIQIVNYDYYNRIIIIHLNLRKLSIQNTGSDVEKCFEINCPQLTTFHFDSNINYYDIVYPERIKSLKCCYNALGQTTTNTDQFINLEYLVIDFIFGLGDFELNNLKKIKELKLISNFEAERMWFNRNAYERLKCELLDLFDQKTEVNKIRENKIKLYLNDEELTNQNQIKMLLIDGLKYHFSSSSLNGPSNISSNISSDS